ncbi:MAG: uracil phosphoribosyltransferase [Defluviitaleaceae bacterium]|nr:uracil phosphoribosyltransferase [Defluviitaleaceae bacterium]
MENLKIIKHPLISHKITMIRNRETGNKEFRELVEELATIICYEATRDSEVSGINISTPVAETVGDFITSKYAVVPILRAGQGMLNGILNFLPTAKVGHIGLYRDPKTLEAVEYYTKLPKDIKEREVFITDPMVATGGSATLAISALKSHGVSKIKLLCLLSCPEGVKNILDNHPDTIIYTTAHDIGLNDKSYIVPGLGDAGDRLYGTQ